MQNQKFLMSLSLFVKHAHGRPSIHPERCHHLQQQKLPKLESIWQPVLQQQLHQRLASEPHASTAELHHIRERPVNLCKY